MTECVGKTHRRHLLAAVVVIGTGVSVLPACTPQGDSRAPRVARESANSPGPPSNPNEMTAQIVGRAELDEVLAECRGQVILVDFWADWCEPCITNLPHVIELAGRLREHGLAVIMVNVNAPEAAERTLEFLKSQRAGLATNLISQYDGAAKSMTAFEIPSGLPCYRIYDRQGTLRHTFTVDPAAQRQFTLQDLDAAIEQLLAE